MPEIAMVDARMAIFANHERLSPCRTGGKAMLMLGGSREMKQLAAEAKRLQTLLIDIGRILSGASLDAVAGEAPAPILDRWFLANRAVPCLIGLSTGHPTLDGVNRSIATSDVWLLSKDNDWARTLSRWYRLGRPAERSGLNA